MVEPVFEVVGTGADAIDYLDAWELQRRVHADVVAGNRPDTVLLLEHPPTYTAGKRTEPHERPVDSGGAPVIEVRDPVAVRVDRHLMGIRDAAGADRVRPRRAVPDVWPRQHHRLARQRQKLIKQAVVVRALGADPD